MYLGKGRIEGHGVNVDALDVGKAADEGEGCLVESIQLLDVEFGTGVVEEFRRLLRNTRSTLHTINLSGSNARGLMFYHGEEVLVDNASSRMVSVESVINGVHVVRDEEAEQLHHIDGLQYQYIETLYMDGSFYRRYVPLNWMSSLRVLVLSGASISDEGLTTVIAMCCSSLEELDVSSTAITDRSLSSLGLTLVLQKLDLSSTSVTAYGAVLLSSLSLKHLASLTLNNTCLNSHEHIAAFVSLDASGFRGAYICEYTSIFPERASLPEGTSILHNHYETSQDKLFDLSLRPIGDCIHDYTLHGVLKTLNGKYLVLRQCLVDDRLFMMILTHVLQVYEGRLFGLDLSFTFITESSLSLLSQCLDLRSLRLCKCQNIRDKRLANRLGSVAIRGLSCLIELDISNTALSGRLICRHDNLNLLYFIASGCPISVFGLRALRKSASGESLKTLRLANCHFINLKCVKEFFKFRSLELLDLSGCRGLSSWGSVSPLRESMNISLAQSLKVVYLTDIPALDVHFADRLKRMVLSLALGRDEQELSVMFGSSHNAYTVSQQMSAYSSISLESSEFLVDIVLDENQVYVMGTEQDFTMLDVKAQSITEAYGPVSFASFGVESNYSVPRRTFLNKSRSDSAYASSMYSTADSMEFSLDSKIKPRSVSSHDNSHPYSVVGANSFENGNFKREPIERIQEDVINNYTTSELDHFKQGDQKQ